MPRVQPSSSSSSSSSKAKTKTNRLCKRLRSLRACEHRLRLPLPGCAFRLSIVVPDESVPMPKTGSQGLANDACQLVPPKNAPKRAPAPPQRLPRSPLRMTIAASAATTRPAPNFSPTQRLAAHRLAHRSLFRLSVDCSPPVNLPSRLAGRDHDPEHPALYLECADANQSPCAFMIALPH